MMAWRRRRRAGPAEAFTEAERTKLAYRWPTWSLLDADEQARLEQLTLQFIADRRWEAAQGFVLTAEMKLLIAAQACLLILELDDDLYRRVGSIIVHPRTMVMHGTRSVGGGGLVADGPHAIDGQAHHRGPVLLSWSTAAYEARHHQRGQNVVYHEFAHQLDMHDGMIDGTPATLPDEQRARWVEVCTAEFEAVRRGESTALRDYAGTDTGEFFAVATETFFTRPTDLHAANADLYGVLQAFYGQDPAARVRAA